MDEKWTCEDLARAIRAPRLRREAAAAAAGAAPPAPPAEEEPTLADAALLTVAKLLTGLGGDIPDSEVRALEGWLDRHGASAGMTPEALEARAARAEADAARMAHDGRAGCFSHVAALREARQDREAAARVRRRAGEG